MLPVVKSIINDAEMTRHFAKEMSLTLPASSASHFPKLFETLQNVINDDRKIGIEGYGISMTTLEEV